jgi:hypothetical protein
MSVENIDSIKKQAANLSPREKSALAKFLLEQEKEENSQVRVNDEVKRRQLEWLKANREKYAGQYVALDGDRFVGHGKTMREAAEQAKQNGAESPFLIRIFSEETAVPAGL